MAQIPEGPGSAPLATSLNCSCSTSSRASAHDPSRHVWAPIALVFFLTPALLARAIDPAPDAGPSYGFVTNVDRVQVNAGIFKRTISLQDKNVSTTALAIDGHACLAGPARELSFSVSFAIPNQKPRGLKPGEIPPLETTAHFSLGKKSDPIGSTNESGVVWVRRTQVEARSWSTLWDRTLCEISSPKDGCHRLVIQALGKRGSALAGLKVSLCFEVYDDFPAIRKWVEFENESSQWLKLDKLIIDDLEIVESCRKQIPLTPGERGAGPSVIAFESQDGKQGFLAVSEIPAALRQTQATGAMGYSEDLFEWVLGPGETFTSEPVFCFSYSGPVTNTISATSAPRDRAVARQRFYAHRGLPLYGIEYYAAHAVNFQGSLTPELQNRQICSWLMGGPAVFAGDLASLTEENIREYRRCFDLLGRLERQYGIYRHFQFSGVPEPTDHDWHWWGKLNQDGCGLVVVLRGSGGEAARLINIPWTLRDRTYQLNALLGERPLGKLSGKQLNAGALRLELPPLGQELLELNLAAP